MSVEAALAGGRAARLQLMRDEVTVTRGGVPVFNPSTGQYSTPSGTVYAGPADVKPRDVQDTGVEVGEREVVLRSYDVALPWSVDAEFAVDDVLTTTASDDAILVGRPLTVIAVGYGGRRTAHHLTVEDRS